MSRTELLNRPLGGLFHSLADFVDLTANHVVELAVVPDKLDVIEHIFVSRVLAREKLLLASGEIHGVFHDLWVVQETHL